MDFASLITGNALQKKLKDDEEAHESDLVKTKKEMIIKEFVRSRLEALVKASSSSYFMIIKDKFSLISSKISYSKLKFIIKTFCLIIFNITYDNSCKK